MSSIAGMLVCFAFGGLSLLFLASYVGAGQRKEKVRKQRRADLFVGAAFGAALMAVFDKALFIIVPTVYRWHLGASAEVGSGSRQIMCSDRLSIYAVMLLTAYTGVLVLLLKIVR